MRITMSVPAGEGQRFAPDAWDRAVGQRVPLRYGDNLRQATIVAAKVSMGGRSVELTYEVEEGASDDAASRERD